MQSPSSTKKVKPTPLTIKGRILIVALLEILLLIFFAGFVVYATHRDNVANTNEAKATDIVKTITEIRFETFDYALYHDSLSYHQWQIEHQRLTGMLDTYPATGSTERLLLDSMQAQHVAVVTQFNDLNASYSEPANQQDTAYQNQVAFRLISKQQIEVSSAFRLADLKHGDALRIRQQIKIFAAIVIFLMFLITWINLVFIYGKISKALTVLQYGASEIARGALSYRIPYTRKTDEFGVLASSFNTMAASLEQVDQVKSEFVLLVSHQLRTPATAVKGFLSLLSSEHGKALTAKQREILDSAYDENERQIALINEILAVAQVEAGEVVLHKEPTNITKIIEDILSEQRFFFTQQHQKVVLDKPKHSVTPAIDGGRIHIVLENLIRNASKFSPPHDTIEIRLKQSEAYVEVSISDNGPGISKADLDKLFKKFSRVGGAETARVEGSGLGLYLAKRIIDLHHGTISVHSRVGKGTTFTIQLPN